MDSNEIISRLELLNEKLKNKEIDGELTIYGGAVMCLCYHSRFSTSDIYGWFAPKTEIYESIREVTEENGFDEGWLNDSVKGFISSNDNVIEMTRMSNLKIYRPVDEYQFAMKCMSCRLEEDEHDIEDIKYLIERLNIETSEQAELIIQKYFPPSLILPKTHFMLLEFIGK